MNKFYEALSEVIAEFCVDNDHWITIGADEEKNRKGTHILVRTGETHKEAAERNIKEWKEDKKEDSKENKKTKENTNNIEYKDISNNTHLIEQIHKQTEKLNEKQKNILKTYVYGNRGEYLAINGTLRNDLSAYKENLKKWGTQKISNLDETVKEWIKNIDEAMDKSSIPDDIQLYRGGLDDSIGKIFKDEKLQEDLQKILSANKYINKNSLQKVKDIIKGRVFTDNGYMSTSYDKNASFKGKIKFKLNVPKGSKGIALDIPNVGSDKEKEILLNRGYKWKVKDITDGLIKGEEVYILDCYLVE